jgi:predicted transcriptional regulator
VEEKEIYTIEELFDGLPCTIVELSNRAGINEVTAARLRDGKPTRRSTVNSVLMVLSEIYKRPLTLKNVSGINVQRNLRIERREARKADSRKVA